MDESKRWEDLPQSLGAVTMFQSWPLPDLPLRKETTWICQRRQSTLRFEGRAVDAILLVQEGSQTALKYLWPISPAERAESVAQRVLIALGMEHARGVEVSLPGVLQVGDRALRRILRGPLGRLGVQVVPATVDVGERLEQVERIYRGPETWLDHPESDVEAVARLHRAAQGYFERAPWKRRSEFEPLFVRLDERSLMADIRGRRTREAGLFLFENDPGMSDPHVARLRLSARAPAELPAARLEEVVARGWSRLPGGRLPHLVRRYPVMGLDQLADGRDVLTTARALEALCHWFDHGACDRLLACGTRAVVELPDEVWVQPVRRAG